MGTRLQNLATAHNALWVDDPWYRLSWFIWPLSVTSLVAGWLIFHGPPAGKAPWAAPAEQALSADETYRLADSAKTDAAAFERLKRLAESGDMNAQVSIATLYDPSLNDSKLTKADVNQAIAWYTKAAEQGQALAQANLAVLFYNGNFGVTQNFATAFFWAQKSAAQGFAAGERTLAICYQYGNGVAADPNQAFQWFEKAANNGDAYAQNALGEAYANGRGVAKDMEKARYWFEQAKAKGNTDAAANLSRVWAAPAEEALSADETFSLRDSAKTDAAAFERLKRLAESGDKNAQFSLGTLYDPEFNFSKLTKPDVTQAIAWYTKAAEQGHALAQANLGLYFRDDKFGVPQNLATAVFWLEKSAAQGERVGERGLADRYRTGTGVAKDPVRALELYRSAANKGDADAESWVGDAYENGWGGVRKDWSEALKWYVKAADQGDAWAQMNVGEAYLKGDGLRRDPSRAFDLLQRAAQQNQSGAQYYLGTMYDQGLATAADPNQAFQWFERAANNGSAAGQNALGVAYAKGRGVAQDREKARYWFEQAKAKGNAEAAANLLKLR
jgi:uncharacterized protein